MSDGKPELRIVKNKVTNEFKIQRKVVKKSLIATQTIWQDLHFHFRSRFFETYKDAQDAVNDILKSYDRNNEDNWSEAKVEAVE